MTHTARPRSTRHLRRPFLPIAAVMLVAACAGSGAPASPSADASTPPLATTAATATPSASASAAADLGPRTITTELGDVTVTGIPERIVVLEWGYLDMLYSLGVEPVGLADVKGYSQWVGAGPRPDASVTDVGLRGEPSIETVAGLEPDLIIDESWGYEYVEQLKTLAPTLVYYPYPKDGEGQFERMQAVVRSLGAALGRDAEAETVLADLDASIASAKASIAATGATGQRFVFVQAWGKDDPGLRIFTKDSMVSHVLEQAGLVNAWEQPGDYGFSDGSVEALATVQDATLLYVAQSDDDPIVDRVASDPVWSALTFAREGRVHPIGGDVWTFGGPLSLEQLLDRVLERVAD